MMVNWPRNFAPLNVYFQTKDRGLDTELDFGWRFDALSASKALFRARTYIQLIQSGDDDYLMNENDE